MNYELYHAGVKGMKWGVRNDKKTTSFGTSRIKRSNSSSTTAAQTVKRKKNKNSNDFRDANVRVSKTRRGAKVVAKHNDTKIKVIISNSTAVAAGALRVAAAFVPGAGALAGVANAAALVGTVANVALK